MDLNEFEKKMVEELLNEVESISRKLLGYDISIKVEGKESRITAKSDEGDTFCIYRNAETGDEHRHYGGGSNV